MKSHAAKNEKMRPAAMVYSKPIDFDRVYRKKGRKAADATQKWWYEVTDNGQKLPSWFLKRIIPQSLPMTGSDDPTKEYFAEQVL